MKRQVALLLASVLTLGAAVLPLRAAERDNQLAQQAVNVLTKSCYKCHGDRKVAGLNVRDHAILVGRKSTEGLPFVTPGKPELSAVFQQVQKGQMPPEGTPLAARDIDILKRWIAAGALFPAAPERQGGPRTAVSEADTLLAIRNHLATLPASRRRSQRYFSLANIANESTADEAILRLYRAGLSKVVNSLSWESGIVLPRPIDRQETVFVVDTADLGWDRRNLWDAVLAKYPYGLTFKYDSNANLAKLSRVVTDATGTDLPCIRADWFIVTATKPELYHKMLDLPANVLDLEKGLNVDIEKSFQNDEVVRAGVIRSGVSKQNRLIERLPTRYGAYWKSYDFKLNQGQSDLLRFPLGPDFTANTFRQRAFKQAGGEIIWNLPNGLQAYLLVNNKGDRINEAPADIVEDVDKTAGSSVIVNGLSCIACHNLGMKRADDVLRTRSGVRGDALAKLQKLHPEQPVLNQFFGKDDLRFQKALNEATASFLRVGADRGKQVVDFKEPVKVVAQHYFGEVTLAQAARELGIEDPRSLKAGIAQSQRLRDLGLAPLLDDTGVIKRDSWEGSVLVQSMFQEAARALRRGIPVVAN